MSKKESAIFLVHCPDQKGIVATVTDFLLKNQGNIINLDQHVDRDEDYFFMKVEWELNGFTIPKEKIADYFKTLIADRYKMTWQLHFSEKKPKVALMVSKYTHCLYDILSRYESGEWNIEIPLVISNHEKLRPIVERHNIPFHHFPINKENKREQEERELELLKSHKVDTVILARYMQIITGYLIDQYPNQIINIHHSSLPAFAGADPYGSAFRRGVKFMGATAHYVTEDLDEGPIISQDVISISHRDSLKDLKRKGRNIEKIVLADAIYAHIHHNVMTYKNKTVVFE
ncbi:MAG: formyltetrahydrofolate deformylase [Saprospiraceae bacterium]|nr:formyltetrahydrofolate deformylase [Saprospiraceae bacterium]